MITELSGWTIYPGDRGYDEVLWDEEQDIDDENIDVLNQLVCEQFEVTVGQLDWRDEVTLWIWDEEQ